MLEAGRKKLARYWGSLANDEGASPSDAGRQRDIGQPKAPQQFCKAEVRRFREQLLQESAACRLALLKEVAEEEASSINI